MKSGFYKQPVMTSSVVGLRRSSKAPKAKLVPRTGHGHCLLVCCQSDPLQLSESWQNHYIWEVCSANWWDAPKTEHTCRQHRSTERVPFFSMTTPGHMMYNQRFKSWTNWSVKFCLICHTHLTSRQLTTTSSNTSTGHRMVSKNSSNPEAWIFTL